MRRAANGDSMAAWGESRLPQSEVERSASHSACLKGGVKRAQPCHGESPVRPSIRSDAASVRRSYRDDVPHEQVLTRLVRAHTTPQKLAERARMILLAAAGTGVRETARQLEAWPKTVRHWLRRWRIAAEAAPVASDWPTHRVRAPRQPSRLSRARHFFEAAVPP